MTQPNITKRNPFDILGSGDGLFASWLRGIKWRHILIGNPVGIDFAGLMMGRALDIVLCGVGMAFVLLIACAAMALPNELRVIVWIGCGFLMALVVDRPTWGLKAGIPLIVMVIVVGTIALSARVAGFTPNWVIYLSIRYGIMPGLTISYGILAALFIAESMMGFSRHAFDLTPQGKVAYEVKYLLRTTLGIRTFMQGLEKDGSILLRVSRKTPVDELRLQQIEQMLQRKTVLALNQRRRQILIILPVGSLADEPE